MNKVAVLWSCIGSLRPCVPVSMKQLAKPQTQWMGHWRILSSYRKQQYTTGGVDEVHSN